jgi:hypothetical protein
LVSAILAAVAAAASMIWADQPTSQAGIDTQPALYGLPASQPAREIPAYQPKDSPAANWKDAPFYVVRTALSPATLFSNSGKDLALLTGMADSGLGGPAFAAYATADGPKVLIVGQAVNPSDMSENWILLWFSGARGWTHWDSPQVVYLQHRPSALKLSDKGLELDFSGPAGNVVLLPLYGYYKPPQEGKDYLAEHKLPSRDIRTWEWSKALPKEVLQRVRYWGKVTRELPVACEESFSVDRAKDTVTIRSRLQWIGIDDDWKTEHLKLAPVSPVLALASLDGKFPVKFSKPPMDPDMFTVFGPYMGIEGVDQYDAVFSVLKYINEMESPAPASDDQIAKAALERLRKTSAEKFRDPGKYQYDHGGMNNFCWAIMGDQWYAKAIPYYDAKMRDIAIASLRKYFHDDVLVKERFVEREWPRGSGQRWLILEGPGIGSWGELGDAGKFSSNLMETLWAYAHFTGDWDLVRQRWKMVNRLFCMPQECNWLTFGRAAIAELGDEAAPPLAYARMAYRVGDMDGYAWGCYIFARELVHHYVKQRGAEYFRLRQPWHSLEFMDEEVYLTNLWGDVAGWQIDGPNYPAKTGEPQYTNRWVRFKNEDVGRFYRDYLKDDVRKELEVLSRRWDAKRMYVNDSHIMPSMVQLRSLLLDELPSELAKVARPEKFGGPASGVIASCVSALRTAAPVRYQRLIPPGEPTAFVTGLERLPVRGSALAVMIETSVSDKDKKRQPAWPLVRWWGWKTPSGATWNFGRVKPIRVGAPARATHSTLNWTTEIVTYEMPS